MGDGGWEGACISLTRVCVPYVTWLFPMRANNPNFHVFFLYLCAYVARLFSICPINLNFQDFSDICVAM